MSEINGRTIDMSAVHIVRRSSCKMIILKRSIPPGKINSGKLNYFLSFIYFR